MAHIDNILSDTGHRPFDLPKGRWMYYQEWNKVLFLHWKIPVSALKQLVPDKLNIDTFDGQAYVSLVAFTMQKIRPRNLPAIKFISDFNEINVRTYIDNNGKKGVYFLNIEAGKQLSAFIAKKLSGLPYEKSNIQQGDGIYKSVNARKNLYLDTEFTVQKTLTAKTALDIWLTERYCLYFDQEEKIYRYDIHHKEWELENLDLVKLNLNYSLENISLKSNHDLIHYSNGVKVIAWKRIKVS